MPGILVIICTHNPREAYLRETLDALRRQTVPTTEWDLLIIDNASTTPLATTWDLSWHPQARIVREDQLGTAHARLRALREATAVDAEIILFVDDDNILAPDYIAQGRKIGAAWPQLGCWGGQLLARYETPPPPWLENYKGLLAITPLPAPLWTNHVSCYDVVPPTAGCFLRRAVWEHYFILVREHPLRLTLGAKGQEQIRGEDTDLVLAAIDIGLGVGRFPEMMLEHIIPAGRLTVAYLENLITGVNIGINVLEFIRHGKLPKSIAHNWLQRRLVLHRAQRLPEPLRTFHLAELRGRERALSVVNNWQSSAAERMVKAEPFGRTA